MGDTAYEQALKKTHTRLKTNALNFWEVSAQAIALISPSMTAALIVPLMFGTAGAAGWLCYLFGTIMLLVRRRQPESIQQAIHLRRQHVRIHGQGSRAKGRRLVGLEPDLGLHVHRHCRGDRVHPLRDQAARSDGSQRLLVPSLDYAVRFVRPCRLVLGIQGHHLLHDPDAGVRGRLGYRHHAAGHSGAGENRPRRCRAVASRRGSRPERHRLGRCGGDLQPGRLRVRYGVRRRGARAA